MHKSSIGPTDLAADENNPSNLLHLAWPGTVTFGRQEREENRKGRGIAS
jgi:hypothetical protein